MHAVLGTVMHGCPVQPPAPLPAGSLEQLVEHLLVGVRISYCTAPWPGGVGPESPSSCPGPGPAAADHRAPQAQGFPGGSPLRFLPCLIPLLASGMWRQHALVGGACSLWIRWALSCSPSRLLAISGYASEDPLPTASRLLGLVADGAGS